jgi:hypothetical protein
MDEQFVFPIRKGLIMSFRELTSHKVNGLNEALRIHVMDEPGVGGANLEYAITFNDPKYGGVERSPISDKHGRNCIISFQNGNPDDGINGISNEALLAIVEDRLQGFQQGPFPSRETAVALTKIQEAMMWLQKRTRDRFARGVEGMQVALIFLALLFSSATCYGQSWKSPLDKWTKNDSASSKPLADLRPNRYDTNSLSNPYGAGSRFKSDGLNNPYSQYGSRFSNQSATNPYATNPPRMYGSDGTYRGEFSANRFAPDSASNRFGRYGSPHSPDSVNNPYGAGNRYSTQPLWVYPSR